MGSDDSPVAGAGGFAASGGADASMVVDGASGELVDSGSAVDRPDTATNCGGARDEGAGGAVEECSDCTLTAGVVVINPACGAVSMPDAWPPAWLWLPNAEGEPAGAAEAEAWPSVDMGSDKPPAIGAM